MNLANFERGTVRIAAALSFFLHTQPAQSVETMCIYYGYPSLVNDSQGNAKKAAEEFEICDKLVLGSKIEFPYHPEHQHTKEIIASLLSTEVIGYIDLGVSTSNLSLEAITNSIVAWKHMGARGIFFDDVSSFYGVSQARFRDAAIRVRKESLKLYVNAWDVDWLAESNGLTDGDNIVLEPFVYSGGRRKYASFQHTIKYSQRFNFYGIATYDPNEFPRVKDVQFSYVLETAGKYKIKGISFTDPNYSATGIGQNKLYKFIIK